MGRFSVPLTTTDLNDGSFRVEREFTYYSKTGIDFTVPQGFVFDCFSIPVGFRWLLPKVQRRGNQASALHDRLYNQRHTHGHSRKVCDKLFLEAMEDLGVSGWRRVSIYNAVRAGGGFYWNKK